MGLLYAGTKLRELSANSSNECYMVLKDTEQVVARLNVPGPYKGAPRLFEVAYDVTLADKLAAELPWCGYRFNYATGNDLTHAILTQPMACDLFILGYAAPLKTRRGMAEWLTSNYPHVPMIALKSASEPDISGAIANVELDGNGALVSEIERALSRRPIPR
jgi:hypothetical protein